MLALLLAISLFRDPMTIATRPQNAFAVVGGEILIASGAVVYRDDVAVLELPAPIVLMLEDDGNLVVFTANEAFVYRDFELIERYAATPPAGAMLHHGGTVIRVENGELLGHRVPTSVTSLAIGDMNNDGLDDITFSAPDVIGILDAQPDGTFAAPRCFRSGGWSLQYALVDIDRDGDLDVLAGGKGERVLILRNVGNGRLDADPVYLTGRGTQLPAPNIAVAGDRLIPIPGVDCTAPPLTSLTFVADINGDGRFDVVLQAPSPLPPPPGPPVYEPVRAFFGNDDCTFTHARSNAIGARVLDLRDYDGDGRPDILDDLGHVHPGNGDGTFRARIGHGAFVMPLAVLVGDINGDRLPDIVHDDTHQWYAKVNRGDGTFIETARGEVRRWSSRLLADIDGDGRLDLVQQRHEQLFDGTWPLRFLRGKGHGTFADLTGGLPLDRLLPGRFYAIDANLDGNIDLIGGTTVLLRRDGGGFGEVLEPMMAERPFLTAVTRGAIVAVIAGREAVTVMRMQPPLRRRAARK